MSDLRVVRTDVEVGSDAGIIRSALLSLAGLMGRVARDLAQPTAEVAESAVTTLRNGGTLFFCGNGGGAAQAQHLAAEYLVRFRRSRPGLRAVALGGDAAVLTAAADASGFDDVFVHQLEALAVSGDMLLLHSLTGNETNLIRTVEAARAMGLRTAAMLANGGGRLEGEVDHAVVVPTNHEGHAHEIHLALGHMICDIVERAFAS